VFNGTRKQSRGIENEGAKKIAAEKDRVNELKKLPGLFGPVISQRSSRRAFSFLSRRVYQIGRVWEVIGERTEREGT
jgi:hypothetical protein